MASTEDTQREFTLQGVRVSPARNELEAQGEILRLQPKVMAVLQYLALHSDRVISPDELIEQVWAGRVVTHSSVQKSINHLRKALAEVLGDQQVVTHFSKKGYQLQIAPVYLAQAEPSTTSAPAVKTANPTSVRRKGWRYKRLSGALMLPLLALLVYLVVPTELEPLPKNHAQAFTTTRAYTEDAGHESEPAPHPDNDHLAYVARSTAEAATQPHHSRLIVRSGSGAEWEVAAVPGVLEMLTWSPDGSSIVAVERSDGDGSPSLHRQGGQLYNVHMFAVDIQLQRVLKTHRLNQWQGRINSISWWGNDEVELVARQGVAGIYQRYRYSLPSQRLHTLPSLSFATQPAASGIQNKMTALVSRHDNAYKVNFLDENQVLISSWPLRDGDVDISWIPDGSGILIQAQQQPGLQVLYLDGERVELTTPLASSEHIVRPRFSADGRRIYYSAQEDRLDLQLLPLKGAVSLLSSTVGLHHMPRFSPSGEHIVFASKKGAQTDISLLNDAGEHSVTTIAPDAALRHLLWTKSGNAILYHVGSEIKLLDIASGLKSTLLSRADDMVPLALTRSNHLIVLKPSSGEVNNLWRLDLQTQAEKQLTFGSIHSAAEFDDDIYFQYAQQDGLWVLAQESSTPTRLAAALPRDSRILYVNNSGVYYISGSICNESDILFYSFVDNRSHTYLPKEDRSTATASFHPKRGAAFSACALAEADIMVLQ